MKRKELKTLVDSVLDNNEKCHINIDVWFPDIKGIKFLLNLGHDEIDPNSTSNECTIFDLRFDNYSCDKSPGFRITIFCKEEEAKFMREHIKKWEEVNK